MEFKRLVRMIKKKKHTQTLVFKYCLFKYSYAVKYLMRLINSNVIHTEVANEHLIIFLGNSKIVSSGELGPFLG